MTAPKASRHSVAVRRTLYSSGWRLRRSAAADRGIFAASSTRAGSTLHERFEVAAAGLEVLVLVEARAGGRQEDDLAGPSRAAGRGERCFEVIAAAQLHRTLQRGRDRLRVLADEEGGEDAAAHRVSQRGEVLALG